MSPTGQIDVVLVEPRNPLNIGAVARAMANFGFEHLTVVAPYAPHWREAKSAVGALQLLQNATQTATLAEAVAGCTFVAGTGTLAHRKPEQPVVRLPEFGPVLAGALQSKGRAAVVFGPEKHGLTREDLSFCNVLVEIPTDPRQPSMNLGQAVAVCLYEVIRAGAPRSSTEDAALPKTSDERQQNATTSGALDRLAELIEETMTAARYSPRSMQAANRHDLRVFLRQLSLSAHDTRRIMGLFRRILNRLHRGAITSGQDS